MGLTIVNKKNIPIAWRIAISIVLVSMVLQQASKGCAFMIYLPAAINSH
jgi:hypothetical protein